MGKFQHKGRSSRRKMSRLFKIMLFLIALAIFILISNLALLSNPSFVYHTTPSLDDGDEMHSFMRARKLESVKVNAADNPGLLHFEEVRTAVFKQNVVQTFGEMWTAPSRGSITRMSNGYIHRNGLVLSNMEESVLNNTTVLSRAAILSFLHIQQDTFEDIVFGLLPFLNFTCEFMQTTDPLQILMKTQLPADVIEYFCHVNSSRVIYDIPDVTYFASTVYLPAFFPNNLLHQQGLIPPNSLRKLKRTVFNDGDIVLYLRESDHTSILLENENEILSVLEASLPDTLGLVVWKSSEHDWRGNQHTFSQARIVLAPRSTAVANVAFCHPQSHVIEITHRNFSCHGNNSLRCYDGLAKAFGLNYWTLFAERTTPQDDKIARVSRESLLQLLSVILDETDYDVSQKKSDILQRMFQESMPLGLRQMSSILEDIFYRSGSCKLLVFGFANDIELLSTANQNGATTLVVAGNDTSRMITMAPKDVTYISGEYSVSKSEWKTLINNKPELLQENFPKELKSTVWDIIIIRSINSDSYLSDTIKPIYWASQIAGMGSSVYIHAVHNTIESSVAFKFFGDSSLLIEEANTAMAKYETSRL
ncbi:uncharacterized protein LOC100367755 [Saccoglossus kowalevskii]|uniref:Uncharacterized protein LOC100367755 isoform X1 n=1 Tax=Saccoglossus kowalevskii TaxID=10224 RepID=A0ABM0GIS5_SACKO|nr:PREDICTED: uncharacterized protein LOC100367755 isoform X1 [Saccoglossus kowalevskii]XP_006811560.1 PREDICTED: uncharacterized protein LOC100367755 isoform X2 [Saccoglossus kowalevskii]